MKRHFILFVLLALLLSLLCACVDNSAEPNNTSVVSEEYASKSVSEDTLFPTEVSEVVSNSTEESKGVVFHLNNENASDSQNATHAYDYCTCGADNWVYWSDVSYTYSLAVAINAESSFEQFLYSKGLISSEQYKKLHSEHYTDYLNEHGGIVKPPFMYALIKYLNLTKDDIKEYQKQRYDEYCRKGGGKEIIPSERQIDILCGNYSDTTVMKELKNKGSYYYEGAVYSFLALKIMASENAPLINELLENDDFKLFLYDYEKVYNVTLYDEYSE